MRTYVALIRQSKRDVVSDPTSASSGPISRLVAAAGGSSNSGSGGLDERGYPTSSFPFARGTPEVGLPLLPSLLGRGFGPAVSVLSGQNALNADEDLII